LKSSETTGKGFATKVQRRFNMCPNRYKLGRARKATLNIIHGDEEEQFALLSDYGEELRRSNLGSKFFLTTNQEKSTLIQNQRNTWQLY
jgi:hypothetical protein